MLSEVRRLLGSVHVEEDDDIITISGLPADVIQKEISKIWKSSKIGLHMFNKIERSKVSFFKFFALEFQYALRTIRSKSSNMITRRTLATVLEQLEQNTWLGIQNEALAPRLNFNHLKDFNSAPLPHQTTFLQTYSDQVTKMRLRGFILASPPGSGKTMMGLMLGHCLEAEAIIIVCPKRAVNDVWVENIDRFIPNHAKVWTSLSGQPIPSGYRYYVCHYEFLDSLLAARAAFKNRKVFVDLDECHNFNDPSSQRVKTFIEFVKQTQAEDVVWASGTPVKALGQEMIPFLRTADDSFTERVEERFKRIFGMKQGIAGDILSHRLGLVTYNVPKSVVMDGKPIEVDIKIRIPNGDRYTLDSIKFEMAEYIKDRIRHYQENYDSFLKTYEEIIATHVATLKTQKDKDAYAAYARLVLMLRRTTDYRPLGDEIRRTNEYENTKIVPFLPNPLKEPFRRAKSVVKYYPLVCRGEVLGRILGRRRIECHRDMVEYSGVESLIDASLKKTLIFTSFVEVVDDLAKHLTKYELNPILVYGDTNKNLTSIVKQFTEDKRVNPMIATLQSLSTAVPILAANTVVFMNQPFRSFEKDQAISRCHRLGQDEQVFVFNILLDTGDQANISTRSADIMEWSKAQVDLLMGTSADASVESFATDLEPQLEIKQAPKSIEW